MADYCYGSKDSYFKIFGPKDHIIKGFRAMLRLGVPATTTCTRFLSGALCTSYTGLDIHIYIYIYISYVCILYTYPYMLI